MNNIKQLKLNKGFTLLEALVAISILMVAVAAPITIAQKGLSSAVYTKDQMIASYLAQDVIEYIKNKRDEVAINNNYDWNNLEIFETCKLDVDNGLTDGCEIDTIINSDEVADDIEVFSTNDYLTKDSDGFYGYGGTSPTKFTRQILIEMNEIDGGLNQALVTVNIRWAPDNLLSVQTVIYNY